MSDNKKYYYLKLKDNFFDSDEIKILESMNNGYKYSNILLKMYLKSIKRDGLLVFNERIPYNAEMIATVTGHNENDVKQALVLFRDMGLIEVLSNGAIYMLDIQNFIGRSSTEADRIRAYRNKIEEKKQEILNGDKSLLPTGCTNVQQMYDKCTPEIEREIDIEIERERDIEIDTTKEAEPLNPIVEDKPNNDKKVVVLSSRIIDKIQSAWNDLGLQELRAIKENTNRYKMLRARINEYSLADILMGIKNIENSAFLKGQNKNGWTITFDWFIRPNNFLKVREGNYNDKPKLIDSTDPRMQKLNELYEQALKEEQDEKDGYNKNPDIVGFNLSPDEGD